MSKRFQTYVEQAYKCYDSKCEKDAKRTSGLSDPPTPILTAIIGHATWNTTESSFIPKILAGVQEREKVNPSLILRGRCYGARMSYVPSDFDVTSIAYKLERLRGPGKAKHSYDKLLRNLVLWNRTAFPDVPEEAATMSSSPGNPNRYQSQWLYHQQCYTTVAPITKYKAAEVAKAVTGSVRKQCEGVDPRSALLLPVEHAVSLEAAEGEKETLRNFLRDWTLVSSSQGLEAKVLRCFDADGSEDEYGDRIEQVLYAFKVANPAAVFGPKEE